MDELVMRSVYLRPSEDSKLRQLAHELNVSKSDLIRSAISLKLRDWLESNSRETVQNDLVFGRRDTVAEREMPTATRTGKKTAGAKPSRPARRLATTDA
jgi:Arc/MetJ-type ribon-helix-helix transcriptional regulator